MDIQKTLFPIFTIKFPGSHGSKYEDGCLLGCCAMYYGRSLLTFQRFFLPPTTAAKVGLQKCFSTNVLQCEE
jgi:hypothetical protein